MMNILKEVKNVKDKKLNKTIKRNVAVRWLGYLNLIVLWVFTIVSGIIKGHWSDLIITVPLTALTIYASINGYTSDKRAIEFEENIE